MAAIEGNPPGSLAPAIILSAGLTNGNNDILIEASRFEGNPFHSSTLTVRIYYIKSTVLSQFDMNGAGWFARAQANKIFVTELSFANTDYIQTTVTASPYAEGGWFYAVQVLPNGIETFGSTPVQVPTQNPATIVATTAAEQVQNVSVTQRNINGVIELTFHWQLPNVTTTPTLPVGPLTRGYVQVWLHNYANSGDWRQTNVYRVQAKSLQFETGVLYYLPDYDGLHNVECHFVACNESVQWLQPSFLTIPAPMVTLVGGIGP